MAERFHSAGYQTAVFTWNPNVGASSGLERGVDEFHDGTSETYSAPSRSSVALHRDFWQWRERSPGSPYWVHFQTLDVHRPTVPPPPFAGLFAPIGTAERLLQEDSTLGAWEVANRARFEADWNGAWWARWEGTGLDRVAYYDARRALYDETMAHQDYQLGRLVDRLKASGEWENTLLVVGSDHSIQATEDFVKLGGDAAAMRYSLLSSTTSRVPLLFVWPGKIPGGQRVRERVSMIDVLPTLLELVGLPEAEVLQGQSLVPLLMGQPGWQSRPVIFEHTQADAQTGESEGLIEVIDGRWGASLHIGGELSWSFFARPSRFLLYDVSEDPLALHPINEQYPDVSARYEEFLTRQFEAHQLLARRFTPGGDVELTAAELERLRTLGYIR
jgi:arylsulfatase A-like enzyme